jgi:hypothetical protein
MPRHGGHPVITGVNGEKESLALMKGRKCTWGRKYIEEFIKKMFRCKRKKERPANFCCATESVYKRLTRT